MAERWDSSGASFGYIYSQTLQLLLANLLYVFFPLFHISPSISVFTHIPPCKPMAEDLTLELLLILTLSTTEAQPVEEITDGSGTDSSCSNQQRVKTRIS